MSEIGLADAIRELRQELTRAIAEREGESLRFKPGPIELELQLEIGAGLGAGVEIEHWVSGSSWWIGEGPPGIGCWSLSALLVIGAPSKKARSRCYGGVWRVFAPWRCHDPRGWCPAVSVRFQRGWVWLVQQQRWRLASTLPGDGF